MFAIRNTGFWRSQFAMRHLGNTYILNFEFDDLRAVLSCNGLHKATFDIAGYQSSSFGISHSTFPTTRLVLIGNRAFPATCAKFLLRLAFGLFPGERDMLARLIRFFRPDAAVALVATLSPPRLVPTDSIDASWRSHVEPDAAFTAILATSEKVYPIIISANGVLLHGARRLRAHKALGRQSILALVVDMPAIFGPDGWMTAEWRKALQWDKLASADRVAATEMLRPHVRKVPKGCKRRDVLAHAVGCSPTTLRRMVVKMAAPSASDANVVTLADRRLA
jgi:hypothetical protein